MFADALKRRINPSFPSLPPYERAVTSTSSGYQSHGHGKHDSDEETGSILLSISLLVLLQTLFQ
jgi:hypothetical protein